MKLHYNVYGNVSVYVVTFQITLRLLSRILCLSAATLAGNDRFAKQKQDRDHSSVKKRKRAITCCNLCQHRGNTDPELNNAHVPMQRHLLPCGDGMESPLVQNRNFINPGHGGQGTEHFGNPAIAAVLGDIEGSLRRMEGGMGAEKRQRREQDRVLWQWKCTATVLDRLFFVLYIFLNIMSLVIFFPRPKDM